MEEESWALLEKQGKTRLPGWMQVINKFTIDYIMAMKEDQGIILDLTTILREKKKIKRRTTRRKFSG